MYFKKGTFTVYMHQTTDIFVDFRFTVYIKSTKTSGSRIFDRPLLSIFQQINAEVLHTIPLEILSLNCWFDKYFFFLRRNNYCALLYINLHSKKHWGSYESVHSSKFSACRLD
jgi:hypothetical protein